MRDRDLYKEIVRHWTHHSRWRERLFVGYLVVLGGLGIAYYYASGERSPVSDLRWLVPAAGLFLAIVFFFMNYRIDEVLDALIAFGDPLEPRPGVFGPKPHKLLSHRMLLRLVYAVTAIALAMLLVYDLGWRKRPGERVGRGAVGSSTLLLSSGEGHVSPNRALERTAGSHARAPGAHSQRYAEEPHPADG